MMISSAWAAEAVRQVADTPIFMTYNFFLTAIGLPLVCLYIRWITKRNDEKVREAVQLKDALFHQSIESIKESIDSWQSGAKERTASLCKKIDDISKELKGKVGHDYCQEKHENVKQDINDLKAKIWA
jgi:gas vesicle protein